MRFLLFVFAFLSFYLAQPTIAQNKMIDLAYIQGTSLEESTPVKPKKPLKPVLKYNPLFWALNGSLTLYQKVVSPQISAGCLYETSCSRFSRIAIHEFGIIKGVALTADRLSRCNRISAAGISRDQLTREGKIIDEPSMYRFQ